MRAFVLLLLAASCPLRLEAQTSFDTTAAIQAADSTAQAWLAIVDRGDIARSWEEGSSSFQLAVTTTRWEQAVKQARGPFEPFGTRRRIMARYTTELPNTPPGQYLLLQYQTNVAGANQVIETVVPMRDGARGWRVSGYFVRPDQ